MFAGYAKPKQDQQTKIRLFLFRIKQKPSCGSMLSNLKR